MPSLTAIHFICATTGDDLDRDTLVKFTIYQRINNDASNPIPVAYGDYKGGNTITQDPINQKLKVTKTVSLKDFVKNGVNGIVAKVAIEPVGDDKWEFDCSVTFGFDNDTQQSFDMQNLRLANYDGISNEHEEYITTVSPR